MANKGMVKIDQEVMINYAGAAKSAASTIRENLAIINRELAYWNNDSEVGGDAIAPVRDCITPMNSLVSEINTFCESVDKIGTQLEEKFQINKNSAKQQLSDFQNTIAKLKLQAKQETEAVQATK